MSRRHDSGLRPTRMLLLLLAVLDCGCYTLPSALEVTPFDGEQVAEMNADQVVDLMVRAHFGREEILELGVDLRDALALHGGARIRNDKFTAAIFLVQDGAVFVTVREGEDLFFELKDEPRPGEPPPETPSGPSTARKEE